MSRQDLEAFAMGGLILLGALGLIYNEMTIVTACVVALVAYVGGKRNGEKDVLQLLEKQAAARL